MRGPRAATIAPRDKPVQPTRAAEPSGKRDPSRRGPRG